jgi:hypothetical protein
MHARSSPWGRRPLCPPAPHAHAVEVPCTACRDILVTDEVKRVHRCRRYVECKVSGAWDSRGGRRAWRCQHVDVRLGRAPAVHRPTQNRTRGCGGCMLHDLPGCFWISFKPVLLVFFHQRRGRCTAAGISGPQPGSWREPAPPWSRHCGFLIARLPDQPPQSFSALQPLPSSVQLHKMAGSTMRACILLGLLALASAEVFFEERFDDGKLPDEARPWVGLGAHGRSHVRLLLFGRSRGPHGSAAIPCGS